MASVNHAGNTPLHWAALNGHLDTLRLLVPALPKSALFLKNQFGHTPLSEAEANAPAEVTQSKQQECAGYLLTFMELENMKGENGENVDEEEIMSIGTHEKEHPPDNMGRTADAESLISKSAKMRSASSAFGEKETPER